METKKFIYYQAEEMFIGWLEEFPDYKTQGENLDELKENLKDLHKELTSGRIPNVLHDGCHEYSANDSCSDCGPCAPNASKEETSAGAIRWASPDWRL